MKGLGFSIRRKTERACSTPPEREQEDTSLFVINVLVTRFVLIMRAWSCRSSDIVLHFSNVGRVWATSIQGGLPLVAMLLKNRHGMKLLALLFNQSYCTISSYRLKGTVLLFSGNPHFTPNAHVPPIEKSIYPPLMINVYLTYDSYGMNFIFETVHYL